MNAKERDILLKKERARLLTKKRMMELEIEEIDKKLEELRKEALEVKMEVFKEEKENLRRL